MIDAKASYSMVSWVETDKAGKTWSELMGQRAFTHADVVRAYQGDIEGEGKVEFLMFYNPNGTANYVGIEEVNGSIAGKKGRFVLQHTGIYKEGAATATFFIVPNSGTEELTGLRGEGESIASSEEASYPIAFKYWFE